MPPVTINVINASAMTTAAFKRMFKALQFQIERDWNTSAWVKCGLAPTASLVMGGTPAPGAWTVEIVPHGNNTGGEGWHEQGSDGSIKGFVNYGSTHAKGISICLIASHEMLEMLVRGVLTSTDPEALREMTNEAGDTWRVEVCDPVVDNSYEVFGEEVADFCEPAWYGLADGLPFLWLTCRQSVAAAAELGPNGYAEVQRAGTTGFVQLTN